MMRITPLGGRQLKVLPISVSALVLGLLTLNSTDRGHAQVLTGGSGEASAAPVCMTRDPATPDALGILVPAADVATMETKGFVVEDCVRRFGSPELQASWRDLICSYAATQSEPMQREYERLMGERPAVLCGMAEQVVGVWVRPDLSAPEAN